ncbi:hypothetical protein PTSG_01653 [Salpingoeca rosetta]|uniref:General transcription factor IIH subunit n=1 Tax=Salpingoeca rosetta (strain ATCC 50818 / BSB-021) TaxID=946362 RepID=F2TYK0_SALR5|nr:uncharacterized protein PTSG_01653 [Salpingoeca rosetta]EGD78674.1 hypothetical protein PTSG_01653 [Salpingoeca rosetta]|eukprot:XP_004997631.1 hypothetical protein PTSG_01653 [Salpingoeca rosetta]
MADRIEAGVEYVWDEVREGEDGTLCIDEITAQTHTRVRKRHALAPQLGPCKRGMIRHVYLVVDLSQDMDDDDLKPNRLTCTVHNLIDFVHSFFHENPISDMGVIVMREGVARVICELNGNKDVLVEHLSALLHPKTPLFPAGEASLQNALAVARRSLRSIPSHATREVVIVQATLASCDPGNILDTIKSLRSDKVTVNVVGLAAAVRICETVCKETGGIHAVALDEDHLGELLLALTTPPAAPADADATQMRLGFAAYEGRRPTVRRQKDGQLGITTGGYVCPQCRAKVSDIPQRCTTCGLMLVSSPHLAKTFHHMFPLPVFKEVTLAAAEWCAGCTQPLPTTLPAYECPSCGARVCLDCDVYVHRELHNCPGCPVTADSWTQHNTDQQRQQHT